MDEGRHWVPDLVDTTTRSPRRGRDRGKESRRGPGTAPRPGGAGGASGTEGARAAARSGALAGPRSWEHLPPHTDDGDESYPAGQHRPGVRAECGEGRAPEPPLPPPEDAGVTGQTLASGWDAGPLEETRCRWLTASHGVAAAPAAHWPGPQETNGLNLGKMCKLTRFPS